MNVRNWNPAEGCAFQGDVAIVPLPSDIAIATADEIKPVDGRLILQEGEVTGHHHAVDIVRVRHFREVTSVVADAATATHDRRLKRALAASPRRMTGTARLFRDPEAVAKLQRLGILTRTNLAVGLLVVEDGPVVIRHEEHDGIRVPPGQYYIGRQIESAGAEERVVAD